MTPLASDLLTQIIRPALAALTPQIVSTNDDAAVLLLRTAAQESGLGSRLVQAGGGPARGIFQMEKITHDDVWDTYLAFRAPLAALVTQLLVPGVDRYEQLAGNAYYACAMARLKYYRSPDVIPPVANLAAQAALYKKVYNGPGEATEQQFIDNAKRFGIT